MSHRSRICLFSGLHLVAAIGLKAAALVLTGTIPLPNVAGRIDHFALDRAGQRLFVAALGNDTVEVIDVRDRRVTKSLPGFDEPQGLGFASDSNRLYIANGGDGTVRVLDGTTFVPIVSIPLGDDADNVRYDPAARRLYVGYGEGAIAVIDTATDKVLARIPVPGHPESFQLSAAGPRIFVNVPQAREVCVLDRLAGKPVVARSLLLAGSNFPLVFDEAGHRLFIGCRSPSRLLLLSADTSEEISDADLHRDCDDLFYDAARHRVYASCGEGFLDVYSVPANADPKRIESIPTTPGARTSFFDGTNLYLAVPKHGDRPAAVEVWQAR